VIARSFDVDRLNYLVNHPTIRPTAGGDGESYLDFTPLMGPENHFLAGEHGGHFFHWSSPDTYEVHIFILPEGRGKWAAGFVQDGLQYARDIGVRQLWARVSTRLMRMFTIRAGFEYRGDRTFDFGSGPELYSLYDWRNPCPQQ